MTSLSLRFGPFRLISAWTPLLATLAAIAVGVTAGTWQLDRAEQKKAQAQLLSHALQGPALSLGADAVPADSVAWHRVRVAGRFDPGREIYLDNRLRDGMAGFEVVTPLRIGASDTYVLVNRGWAAAGPSRAQLPQAPAPSGRVEVEGLALPREPARLELGSAAAQGRVWENLSPEAYARATGLHLQPVVIRQVSPAGDGLRRDWPQPASRVAMHLGYAVQWYGLALAALAYFVATHLRRVPHDCRPA